MAFACRLRAKAIVGPSPCFDLTANPGLAFSFLNPQPAYYDLTAIGFETPMVAGSAAEEEEVIEDMTDTTDTMSVPEPVSDPMPDDQKPVSDPVPHVPEPVSDPVLDFVPDHLSSGTMPDYCSQTLRVRDPVVDVPEIPSRFGYEFQTQNPVETCLYVGDFTVKYSQ